MSQSISHILLHVIFSTKKREPLILPEIIEELHSYISAIARENDSQVYEIGGIEDHVHLLISLPRTLSVSKLVEEIKRGSSKWMKTKGSRYINFAWQRGYGVFSIGQSGYENLRQYIQKQKEHHQKFTFQEEYRNFLKKYCIAYDEKYVWD